MKSEKRTSFFGFGFSYLVFLIIALWGRFFLKNGDEMRYVILSFYLIMPIVSFVTGIILGLKDVYLKWVYPALFGLLGIILPFFIFSYSFDWISIFFSLVPAVFGLLIGILIKKRKNGHKPSVLE